MLSSARTFSKQVLNHRSQIQQQTKSQLRNQHNGPRAKDQQQQQQQSNSSNPGSSNRHDDDVGGSSGRQVVLEKMRLENRERKKRWREVNEERNKDNDLRCRVNKRANQLYGAKASDDKEKWIGEEFVRRQQRRRDKEQRRRGTGAGASAGAGAGSGSSGPREAQRQQSQSLTPERILPSGFGSYATLPPHQVSAAHSFWKSVAAQQALEETAASSSTDSAAQPFAAAPGNAGLRLPPLSSIVPRELLSLSSLRQQQQQKQHQQQPPAHVATQSGAFSDAAGHAGMTAPLSPNPPPASSFVAEAAGPRRWHVRPWEEISDSSGGDRLAEAAFSLMTLSSNSPPLHYASAAANGASAATTSAASGFE
ncbi:hypothetical protein GGI11_007926 [Coemansia sp. RSA 2049]|nr:hypothetical protein GGI11_007926 [Coemansia sp. RSA 2049]KAJ2692397.1 hypothetical protein GGH99_001755 [Coemansia sp. RSA 1285]